MNSDRTIVLVVSPSPPMGQQEKEGRDGGTERSSLGARADLLKSLAAVYSAAIYRASVQKKRVQRARTLLP